MQIFNGKAKVMKSGADVEVTLGTSLSEVPRYGAVSGSRVHGCLPESGQT